MQPGKMGMMTLMLVIGAMLACVRPASGEVTSWENRLSMPDARYMGAAAAAGGVFYTGGLDQYDAPRETVFRYDPYWNTWLMMSSMATERYGHAAVDLGGLVYVIGGRNDSGVLGSVEVYDPLADTWTPAGSLTTPRYGHGAVVARGMIYVFGGLAETGNYFAAGEVYDPGTDSWTSLPAADMIDARAYFPLALFPAAVTGEEEIFAMGGETFLGPIRDTESLLPGTDTWSARGNLGTARSHFTAVEMYHSIFGRELYAIGGLDLGGPCNRVDSRNEFSQNWNATGTSLINARYAHGACALGDVIHVLGGNNGGVMNSHEASVPEFDPVIDRAVVSLNTAEDGTGESLISVYREACFSVYLLLDWSMYPSISSWEGRIEMSDNLAVDQWFPGAAASWTGGMPGNVRVDFDIPQYASGIVVLASMTLCKTADGPSFVHLAAHDTASCDPPAPCYGDWSGTMLPMDGAGGSDGQPLFMVIPDTEPPPPTNMEVAYSAEGNTVSWVPAPWAVSYRIYRSQEESFSPSPELLVAVTEFPPWVDTAGSWSDFYLMTAVDEYGAQSEAASPWLITGVDRFPLRAVRLYGAYPNPFNPGALIRFDLPRSARVRMEVFDVFGRLVRILVEGEVYESGTREVFWDGRDKSGQSAASGTYFCRMTAGGAVRTSRMMLVK